MSLARLKPFYVSLSVRNNKIDDNPFRFSTADSIERSRVVENFRQPILEKASDFLCAVERMELNLNGVPFYDASSFVENHVQNQETLVIRSKLNNSLTWSYTLVNSAYSISHLFEILNSIL